MQKLFKIWNQIEKLLVGGFILGSVIMVLYAVFMRYVMEAAPEWVEELVIYLVIWAVYIVCSTLAEERGHVGATFVVDLLPAGIRRWIEVAIAILGLIFAAFIAYYGFLIVDLALISGEVSESTLRFPMWVAYLTVPVGMTLLFFRLLKRLWFLIMRFSPDSLSQAHKAIPPDNQAQSK
ncbi:MAG: TRAP transporter small permease [Desulfarculaceae bacterium]|jgi:C4-dicarboxylate transporter DctQ subunit